ncbi:MAG: hypothetical protein QM786_13450 [Breznakibacter sp.]
MKEFQSEFSSNIDVAETTCVSTHLTKLIDVTEPYFALKNLTWEDDGYLKAEVQIEMTDHFEIPFLSLSEAGRHVAILGSLALAQDNPRKEKHYYLACDAVFDRVHSQAISSGKCYLRAKTLSIDKRAGIVHGQLFSDSGVLTYDAEVRYAIIHHEVFGRKFSSHFVDSEPRCTDNPYARKTPVRMEKQTSENHTGYIDSILRNDCAGHFNHYPALPVARISGAMFELSGDHYNILRNSDSNYCIRRVEMHAESFIFAGEKVKITTEHKEDLSGKGTLIEAHALINPEFDYKAVVTKCWFY